MKKTYYCHGCHCNFGAEVDGNKTSIYDGIITIFSGEKIKRVILTADGTKDDKVLTLEDCRKIIGDTKEPVTVIFDDAMHGEIYNYGNYGAKWHEIGKTIGYA